MMKYYLKRKLWRRRIGIDEIRNENEEGGRESKMLKMSRMMMSGKVNKIMLKKNVIEL